MNPDEVLAWLFIIGEVVFFLFVAFSVDFIYGYLKYHPLLGIAMLILLAYVLNKVNWSKTIPDKYSLSGYTLLWFVSAVIIVLLIALGLKVFE